MTESAGVGNSAKDRHILITGATDGIGWALARLYRARDCRLILVGRRPLARLDEPLFNEDTYCQVDLAQPRCEREIVAWLASRSITHLDLLIHNAGLGYVGAIAAQPPQNIRALIAVNLEAPVTLTHALLPWLRPVRGKVVFVSSVASALPTPTYAVYTATKAAVDGLARNLRIELGGEVPVQVIHPGATRTGMHRKAGAEVDTSRFARPEDVAQRIAAAVETDRAQVTIGAVNQLVRWNGRALGPIIDRMMRAQRARRQKTKGKRQKVEQGRASSLDRSGSTRRDTPDASGRTTENGEVTALITGAADGIGRALAFRCAAAGYAILGVDVDGERSAQTAAELRARDATATFIQADLADAEAVTRLVATLAQHPPVDLLVHNAGINAVGAFGAISLERQRAVIAVNLMAPLLITAGLLRANRLRTNGALVFLSSLSHYVSYPGAAVYAATKDGLASYARSLRVALAAQRIHVLTVFPGPTRTAHARRYSPDNRREEKRMPPADLADRIVRAVARRQWTLIPGVQNQVSALAGRLLPALVERVMRRAIYEKLVTAR